MTKDETRVYMPMLAKYAMRMADIIRVARELGYAIAVHGSGQRDLDLIAVPWVEDASLPERLVTAIAVAIDGVVVEFDGRDHNPTYRPHGRMGYSIQIGSGLYIDLAVMPLAKHDEVQYSSARLDVPPLGVVHIIATGPSVYVVPPKDCYAVRAELIGRPDGGVIIGFGKKVEG